MKWRFNISEESKPVNLELEIETVRQRYGLYKVITGTLIVGVVAAALPFIIDLSKVGDERETGRKDFVGQYIEHALEEDIEVRIRFADYFAHVLPIANQKKDWEAYRNYLKGLKDETEKKINEKIQEKHKTDNQKKIATLESEIETLQNRLNPLRPIYAYQPSTQAGHILRCERDKETGLANKNCQAIPLNAIKKSE